MKKILQKIKLGLKKALNVLKVHIGKVPIIVFCSVIAVYGLSSCLARDPTEVRADDDNNYTIGQPQVVFKKYMFGWNDGMLMFDFYYNPVTGQVAYQDIFGNAYGLSVGSQYERTDFIPYVIGDVQGNILVSVALISVPESPDLSLLYDFSQRVLVSWDIPNPDNHTLRITLPVGSSGIVIDITPRSSFVSANYGVVTSIDKAPNWTLDSLARLSEHYKDVGYNDGVNSKSPIATLVGYVDDFLNVPLFGDTLRISNILQLGFGLVLLGFIIKIFLGG